MFFDIVQNEMIDNKIYNSSFYKVRLNNDLITKYKDILVSVRTKVTHCYRKPLSLSIENWSLLMKSPILFIIFY